LLLVHTSLKNIIRIKNGKFIKNLPIRRYKIFLNNLEY